MKKPLLLTALAIFTATALCSAQSEFKTVKSKDSVTVTAQNPSNSIIWGSGYVSYDLWCFSGPFTIITFNWEFTPEEYAAFITWQQSAGGRDPWATADYIVNTYYTNAFAINKNW